MNNVNLGQMQNFMDAVKKEPKQALKEKASPENGSFKRGNPNSSQRFHFRRGKSH